VSSRPSYGKLRLPGRIDLEDLTRQMSGRSAGRTEADLQAQVRDFLVHGDLDLEDDHLAVRLETQAGGGRRIDVEIGFTVIECKKNLRAGRTLDDAIEQLGGYLRSRTDDTGQRYAGILTDGREWKLYALVGDQPTALDTLIIDPVTADSDRLKVWLEGVLATRQQIFPTPHEIRRRLGAGTPSYRLDRAALGELYAMCRTAPEIQVKRLLWARLLTTAFGSAFTDDDELFLEHTFLVIVAELIAHQVAGLDIRDVDGQTGAADLLSGRYFERSGIAGVVEADFFDWVADSPGGDLFVRDVARRVGRFKWSGPVEHDVLKMLYESVVSPEQRHDLGEYYTPDWLAEHMVAETVTDPLNQRVLDPSCGSGTFLFAAVRSYLAAADAAGVDNPTAVAGATEHVFGIDVHPVAVTLARVTYLLALGFERLQDRGSIRIPVNLGDSLQWNRSDDMFTNGDLVVPTLDGEELFASELRWPASTLTDAQQFDSLVANLTDRATSRKPGDKPLKPITAVLNAHAIDDGDRATVETTYKILCSLHDHRRNHIWGYYVRNLARPYWLTRPGHRPDVLIGNPPWLSYRYMTPSMKERFRDDSQARGLWAGAAVATSQDLSGYFVARCVELYLDHGGRFAFVMPLAAITRAHFAGFRKATYPSPTETTAVQFANPWDLHGVRPDIFPMPSSVVSGTRTSTARPMGTAVTLYQGRFPPDVHLTWRQAEPYLTRSASTITRPTGTTTSPYGRLFRQGASIVPRALVTVERTAVGQLGISHGLVPIRSLKSTQDKEPWKGLPPREGAIEEGFLHPLHLGTTLAPFRMLAPLATVLPLREGRLLNEDELDAYPAMQGWWADAESLWRRYRTSTATLAEWVNYQGKLAAQAQPHPHRVVYNRSGTRLVAAYVPEVTAVIDTKLYWGRVGSRQEADYLCAIFNSATMTELVNPVQSKGNFGPRDFYGLPFEFPIPIFDPSDTTHTHLADVGRRSADAAATLELPEGVTFQVARREIGAQLAREGLADEGNILVRALLLA